ncbi:RDD domain containing protein [Desulfovibrio sp. X2]|uniref:RDD family protein n=1 Tax=Desulfovibrio sp. X2 TaxID=941449 RepID=UPI000358D505|nr:RDD family protein [Desulfovibrio sp. X2]EPR41216.1 RDD domain containing protein [Desulfovibrio sp. X2]
MKTCPKCGENASDQARFCPSCGTKLDGAQRDDTASSGRFGAFSANGSSDGPDGGPDEDPWAHLKARRAAEEAASGDRPPAGAAYADFPRRLLAFVVDQLLLGGCSWIVGMVIGLLMNVTIGKNGQPPEAFEDMFLIIGVSLSWGYYALFESSPWQATPGKRLLNLFVTDLSGRRLGFGRASARFFGKFVSGFIFLLGYIMAAFTRRRQALHDMIAGTLVLRKE